HPDAFGGELLGRDDDWYIEHADTDLVFVRARDLDGIGEVAVVSDGGPYDPLEILVANAVAGETGATIRFVHAVEDADDGRRDDIAAYHDELAELCTVPTESAVLAEDDIDTILSA